MSNEQSGIERRDSPRKSVYLPLRLIAKGHVISTGHVLNINCYGIKLEITFKTIDDKTLVDELLSAQDLTLEIGKHDTNLHIITSVGVKWSNFSYGEGEKIYEAGLDLKLSNNQKQEWEKFYKNIACSCDFE